MKYLLLLSLLAIAGCSSTGRLPYIPYIGWGPHTSQYGAPQFPCISYEEAVQAGWTAGAYPYLTDPLPSDPQDAAIWNMARTNALSGIGQEQTREQILASVGC